MHCFRGKSRSAACVVQILMQVEGLSLKEAMAATRAARPTIDINVGFRKLLMELEGQLWPGREPSVVLKLKSRRPTLTSSRRPPARSRSRSIGSNGSNSSSRFPEEEGGATLERVSPS